MKPQLLVTLLVAVVLAACRDMCGNEISQSVASPSGSLKAVVFARDCGATTGFSTQVSILPNTKSLPNEAGNVLVLNSAVPIALQWQTDTALTISGLRGSSPILNSPTSSGVAISYDN
jgi:hypothetical protein